MILWAGTPDPSSLPFATQIITVERVSRDGMLLNCRLLKGVVSGDVEGVVEIGRETSSRRHTA